MSIHTQKQRWKLWLAVAGVLIVASTLFYTGIMVRRISADERKNVNLWAEAVKKRANLVNDTKAIFAVLETDERKKAEELANASLKIISSDDADTLTYYSGILERNTTIPTIVTYENGEIFTYRNLSEENNTDSAYLQSQLKIIKEENEPIELSNKQFGKEVKYFLYYGDTKVYRTLRDVTEDLITSFISETVINSASVPVVYTDSTQSKIIAFGNIDSSKIRSFKNDAELIQYVKGQNKPIEIEIGNGEKNYIFYRDSNLIRQLKFFPFVQLSIIAFFLLAAYFLFSTSRRSEQNRVWVGMSKETAHQLGTPLSSLVGWVEILKSKGVDENIVKELGNDVDRLQIIAERFSKVGSVPELKEENLEEVLQSAIRYMEIRTSDKIKYSIDFHALNGAKIKLSRQLFEWVIENLCRNAVDAIHGAGSIHFEINEIDGKIQIDVTDSGKGIPKNLWKTVFKPGYTTKKRGWGLGLSLTKRIIEEYHKGKIFVKHSEPGTGTTFRIILNKR